MNPCRIQIEQTAPTRSVGKRRQDLVDPLSVLGRKCGCVACSVGATAVLHVGRENL
jgi:hypothetical protein